MQKELAAAQRIARAAGKIVLSYYGKAKTEVKRDGSYVTDADKASETFIKGELSRTFPTHSFLGEETGKAKKDSEYTWIVDPIDGTTNFKTQNPFFNISIALAKNNTPVAGAVYFPIMDELFSAALGKGASLNGKKIHASSINDIPSAFLMYCPGQKLVHSRKMLRFEIEIRKRKGHIRHLGAAALELCYTACGRGEAFLMPDVKPWDVAAGVLILTEAGGKVTTYTGRPFIVSSASLIASNGAIHSTILPIIKKIYK